MKVLAICMLLAVSGCASLSRGELDTYRNRTLYTCCNIHYESFVINDANYHVGQLLPIGTPVRVTGAGNHWVKFQVAGGQLKLMQEYGTNEPFREYLNKILVPDDPRIRLASFPLDVQQAIIQGRVERRMTREQVIMAVGYPPTHRTSSIASDQWTYWYSRFRTYGVIFGEDGKVSQVGASPSANVLTTGQGVKQ
jgi:hypothetical protein